MIATTRAHLTMGISRDTKGYVMWVIPSAGISRVIVSKGKSEGETLRRGKALLLDLLETLEHNAQDTPDAPTPVIPIPQGKTHEQPELPQ